MDILNSTISQGFIGTFIALLMGYLGKLLITPNERVKQLNEIITQHTDLIHKLSEQVNSVLAENHLLQLRIKELEQTMHALESENSFLKLFKKQIEEQKNERTASN